LLFLCYIHSKYIYSFLFMKYFWLIILFTAFVCKSQAQEHNNVNNNFQSVNDSIKKAEFLNYIGNGYYPTKNFKFDLRYLIKFNQYEGFRTGLGGVTNENFSEILDYSGIPFMVF